MQMPVTLGNLGTVDSEISAGARRQVLTQQARLVSRLMFYYDEIPFAFPGRSWPRNSYKLRR
jgi:hypothetical protein